MNHSIPLLANDLVSCDVYESFTMPTKAEIQARRKSDQLCKSLSLSGSKYRGSYCSAYHMPSDTFQSTISKSWRLCIRPKISWYTFFWWNKPLNVNQSIRVFPKSEPPLEMQPRAREPIPEARKSTWEAIGKGLGTILMLIGKRMSTWVVTSVTITAIPLLIVFCW